MPIIVFPGQTRMPVRCPIPVLFATSLNRNFILKDRVRFGCVSKMPIIKRLSFQRLVFEHCVVLK